MQQNLKPAAFPASVRKFIYIKISFSKFYKSDSSLKKTHNTAYQKQLAKVNTNAP